jgi:histidyl-tRNA synthetase
LDPFLVRGLDYYARTAFEVHGGALLGAQNAIAGGGRYDGLVEALGGGKIPGIGFAVGLERLVSLLVDKVGKPQGPEFYLAILSPGAMSEAIKLSAALRKVGHTVAVDWEPGSLKSRLKRADKFLAGKAIMLGDDEISQMVATVKDLKTGEQVKVPLLDFVGALASLSLTQK